MTSGQNSSEAGVNESGFFHSDESGSPGFGSIEQSEVLKILILVLVSRSNNLQAFFSCWKAALALLVRFLISTSVPPVLSVYDAA